MPMIADHHPIGAMNFYATHEDAFGVDDVETERIFAMGSGFLLANAQAYWDARILSEGINTTMRNRAMVERATGILMSTHQRDPSARSGGSRRRAPDGRVNRRRTRRGAGR